MRITTCLALAALLVAGCGDDEPTPVDSGSPTDTGSTSDTGSASDSGACVETAIAQLCVRGAPAAGQEDLTAGELRFQIYPEGCHSSACTVVEQAGCTVTESGGEVTLDGSFCLRTEGMCTLPDCSGGGDAICEPAAPLADGDYTVTDGTLTVSFTLPSTIDPGGVCAGSM